MRADRLLLLADYAHYLCEQSAGPLADRAVVGKLVMVP